MSSAIGPADRLRRPIWRRGVLPAAALIFYQLLVHWAVSAHADEGIGVLLVIAPLAAPVIWFLLRSSYRLGGLLALMVAGSVGWLIGGEIGADPTLLYPLPHVGAYLFMLWLFGRTLSPGHEALVTRLARHVHGVLPDPIVVYTRRVTLAWCVFFGCQVITSVLLFVFAPLEIWSLFANLLNLPLLAAMFLGEYLWRHLRHPDFSHASIATAIRAFQQVGGSAPGSARSR